jgi:hypothetical protein
VLVGDPGLVELGLELGLEDLGEQVLEPAVVGLEDRVLGRQVDRVTPLQAVVQRRRAKSRIESSRLYIAIATPPPGDWNTSRSIGSPPSLGWKVSVSVPSPGNVKSVARYWTPNA